MSKFSPADLYDSVYKKYSAWNSSQRAEALRPCDSLLEFCLENGNWDAKANVLELGCGAESLAKYIKQPFAHWLGVDFSQAAISMARQQVKLENVQFQQADVTLAPSLEMKKVDLIIDAHCFHCLTSKDQARQMLYWSLSQLTHGGRLLIETMVAGPQLSLDYDYCWNGEQVLQKLHGEWRPVRLLLDHEELLELLREISLRTGVSLSFYTIDTRQHMSVMGHENASQEGDPYRARAIFTRA